MCLMKIYSNKKINKILTPKSDTIIAYKVITLTPLIKEKNGITQRHYYSINTLTKFEIGRNVDTKQKLIDTKDLTITLKKTFPFISMMPQQYETGFHCFEKYADANTYKIDCCSDVLTRIITVEIDKKDILTIGKQNYDDIGLTYVAKEIFISFL